jgi:MFS family permease
MGATMAPRVEILTMLACDQLRPEYTAGRGMEDLGIHDPWAKPIPAVSPAHTAPVHSEQTYNGHALALDLDYSSYEAHRNGTVPPNPKLCKTDPVVQAGVAKLQTTMTTVMGVLGVLTVGWWVSLSDRYGRTFIVGVTILGRIFEDFNFIFVSMFAKRLPGGYWFLLIGPILEGTLGGISAASAAIHAYVSDCTTPAERSRAFSLLMGTFFIGMALGPTIGGLMVKHTGNILSVYYLATSVHVLYAIVLWTVLPESRSPAQLAVAQRKYETDHAAMALKRKGFMSRVIYASTGSLRPLAIFIPRRIESASSPGKLGKRDYRFLLIVAAQASVTMIFGGIPFKLQYVQAVLGWTSVEMGYWLTSIGITRALHLTIVLPCKRKVELSGRQYTNAVFPVVIKLLKPKESAVQLPVEQDEPLNGDSSPQAASSSNILPAPSADANANVNAAPTSLHTHREHNNTTVRFDLNIARGSLLIDLAAYTIMPLTISGTVFLGAAMLSSFGGGLNPALQAVALELFARQPGRSVSQAGTLFGALSVLNALVSQVIGPALFGGVYLSTVAFFPQAIFVLTAVLIVLAFVFVALVRLPKNEEADVAFGGLDREATVIGNEGDERGRKPNAIN